MREREREREKFLVANARAPRSARSPFRVEAPEISTPRVVSAFTDAPDPRDERMMKNQRLSPREETGRWSPISSSAYGLPIRKSGYRDIADGVR